MTARGMLDAAMLGEAIAAGEIDTVLVAFPDQLRPEQAETVRDIGADLVVIGSQTPEQFAAGVELRQDSAMEARQPVCALAVAGRAGIADTGGLVSIAPAIEMQMRHGMPPLQKAIDLGLKPSLSVDVECNMTADMFTVMRSAFTWKS